MRPLVKPVKSHSLTPELERNLLRRYWENDDKDALAWLVEAHRPMVVRMAKHMPRAGVPLKVLVEYGILGLRIAAQPPRPSKTKKGKMVGFDFAQPYRFSTYARQYAAKEMRTAVSGDLSEALKPDFQYKTTASIETWGEPEPEVNEDADWPRDLSIPHPHHSIRWSHYSASLLTRPWRIGKRADPDYWRAPKFGIWQSDFSQHPYPGAKFSRLGLSAPLSLSASSHRCSYQSASGSLLAFVTERLGYARHGVAYLQRRRWQYCCKLRSTLWNLPEGAKDQYERKVKPRNYSKHPITSSEWANRDASYKAWSYALKAVEKIAKEGMEGWEGNDDLDPVESDSAEFMVATFLRNHAFKGKQFRVKKKWRLLWRKMGCKRLGQTIKLRFNMGLGVCDRRGHVLPNYEAIFGASANKVEIRRVST